MRVFHEGFLIGAIDDSGRMGYDVGSKLLNVTGAGYVRVTQVHGTKTICQKSHHGHNRIG